MIHTEVLMLQTWQTYNWKAYSKWERTGLIKQYYFDEWEVDISWENVAILASPYLVRRYCQS